MKLTTTHLKKIIAEEVAKARLAEAPDDGVQFYKTKLSHLARMQDRIEDLVNILYDLKSHEVQAPGGDLSELQVLDGPLTALEEEVSGLIDAVESMI